MATTPSDVVAAIVLRLQPLGPVRARAMFGGHGLFLDDRMFALIADGDLYPKVDEATEPAFRAAGAAPFVYDRRGTAATLRYWSMPADPTAEPGRWLEFAAYGLAAAARSRARGRRRTGQQPR